MNRQLFRISMLKIGHKSSDSWCRERLKRGFRRLDLPERPFTVKVYSKTPRHNIGEVVQLQSSSPPGLVISPYSVSLFARINKSYSGVPITTDVFASKKSSSVLAQISICILQANPHLTKKKPNPTPEKSVPLSVRILHTITS